MNKSANLESMSKTDKSRFLLPKEEMENQSRIRKAKHRDKKNAHVEKDARYFQDCIGLVGFNGLDKSADIKGFAWEEVRYNG